MSAASAMAMTARDRKAHWRCLGKNHRDHWYLSFRSSELIEGPPSLYLFDRRSPNDTLWKNEGELVVKKTKARTKFPFAYYARVPWGVKEEFRSAIVDDRLSGYFRIQNQAQNDKIKISAINLSSRNPFTLQEEFDYLRRYNLNFPVWTTHGVPFAGLFGIESVKGLGKDGLSGLFNYTSGDLKGSEFYWMDLLEDHGVEYFLPANRTTLIDTLLSIKELVRPFRFNDGVRRYSFERFFSQVPNVDSSKYPNLSSSSALGHQITAAISQLLGAENGSGAVIYTHWGMGDNLHDSSSSSGGIDIFNLNMKFLIKKIH